MAAATATDSEPFKIVLVGDSGVGKSSVLLRFADDSWSENYIATIGVDFRFRTVKIGKELVKLQIWDTAGQERFRTITNAFYRGADGIVLVYDVTNMKSFDAVEQWLTEIERYTSESAHKILVGNKADVEDERLVTEDQGRAMADAHGIAWLETSAKTATNVDAAFEALTIKLLAQRKRRSSSSLSSSMTGHLKEVPCRCAIDACRCDDRCGRMACRRARNQHHALAVMDHPFQERCPCTIL